MSIHDQLVYGEHIDDLFAALEAFVHAGSIDEDGMFVSSVELPGQVGQPILRALTRVEAELLLEDAEALRSGCHEDRTSEQRAADAFVRLADAVLRFRWS